MAILSSPRPRKDGTSRQLVGDRTLLVASLLLAALGARRRAPSIPFPSAAASPLWHGGARRPGGTQHDGRARGAMVPAKHWARRRPGGGDDTARLQWPSHTQPSHTPPSHTHLLRAALTFHGPMRAGWVLMVPPSGWSTSPAEPDMSLPQFFAGFALVTVAFPFGRGLCLSMVGKLLGDTPQGTWMGVRRARRPRLPHLGRQLGRLPGAERCPTNAAPTPHAHEHAQTRVIGAVVPDSAPCVLMRILMRRSPPPRR